MSSCRLYSASTSNPAVWPNPSTRKSSVSRFTRTWISSSQSARQPNSKQLKPRLWAEPSMMRVLCPAHTILELAVRCFRNPNGGILTSRRLASCSRSSDRIHFGATLAGSHCDMCVRGCLPFSMSISEPVDGRGIESSLEAAVILSSMKDVKTLN